jgi:hypothetical protein
MAVGEEPFTLTENVKTDININGKNSLDLISDWRNV